MADHVLERRLVEQGGRHDVLHVEPATGLADVFHNVIAREMLFESFLVFERVMVLGEAHGTGFEPAVHHVADAVHVLLPVGSSGLTRVSSSMYGRCMLTLPSWSRG